MKLLDGWTTEPITIATAAGETCIPAFVNGALAVHPNTDDNGWYVTHRRTGRAIVANRDSFSLTQEMAFRLAGELLANVTDWEWDTLEAIPTADRAVIAHKLWAAKRGLLGVEVQL